MAMVSVTDDEVRVELSAWERTVALHAGVRAPLAAVREVSIEPHPWSALRGIRAPGTGIPGLLSYGVRRMTGDRPDFAVIRRGRPVVRIELDPPSTFARLLVSVRDAEATVSTLSAAMAR